ncbi:transposase [Streptomyces sp. ET3-23]|uniref:transposase n=1 Tax=Streptomyces sp. ET3-23 TaxID=2885643 RepID=UPI001D118752|nr:transposase [Streptomyces sp. ET3-23]MCC2280865.1 transposase [Streptomyces sp. ET3-23]
MPEIRKRYDAEFRAGAVRNVRETGKPIALVTRDLGINEGTLSTRVSREKEATRAGLDPDERAELARLRKENHELRMERDVLQAIGGPVGQGGDEACLRLRCRGGGSRSRLPLMRTPRRRGR